MQFILSYISSKSNSKNEMSTLCLKKLDRYD